MKRVNEKIFLSFFFLFFQSIAASHLDFRVAGFIPNSELFRTIYHPINPVYQAELSCIIKRDLQFWANVSFLHVSGKSCPLNVCTDLNIIIPSLGLKYLYQTINRFGVYVGAGLCYSWLKETNHSTVHNKANHFGGIFKFGIQKQYKQFHFTLFSDYLLQTFNVDNPIQCKSINSHGLMLGIGIGVVF